MRRLSILFILLLPLCANAAAPPDAEKLDERYQRCIHAPGGREYEKESIAVFWGKAQFMASCVPKHQDLTQAINIFIEVREDGSMKQLYFLPNNDSAKCIESNVVSRTFRAPPTPDCVLKIRLKFGE